MGTPTLRRTRARSWTSAVGCSTYSSPPAALSSKGIRVTASSTDQAPLASTRMRPSPPRASRTASSLACSSARLCPGSATFTLAVRQPLPARTISAACSGPTAGTVTFTGTVVLRGSGQPWSAASRAARSPGSATRAAYSRNGVDSPQPASPRKSIPSRTSMPRNRVRIGIEYTCGSGTGELLQRQPVDLPVAEEGQRVDVHDLARCPGPRVRFGDPVASVAEVEGADQDRDNPVPPPVVRDAEHLGGPHVGMRTEAARDRGGGHVDASRDHHVVDPAEHLKVPVLVDLATVQGDEPAAFHDLLGEARIRVVPVEEHRSSNPDPIVGPDLHRDAIEREPVVHAAAAGLAHAVGRDDPDANGLGRGAQVRVEGRAAEEHRVEARQGPGLRGVLEDVVQLCGYQ